MVLSYTHQRVGRGTAPVGQPTLADALPTERALSRGHSVVMPAGKQKSPPRRAFMTQRKQEVAHRSGLTGFTALRTLADP